MYFQNISKSTFLRGTIACFFITLQYRVENGKIRKFDYRWFTLLKVSGQLTVVRFSGVDTGPLNPFLGCLISRNGAFQKQQLQIFYGGHLKFKVIYQKLLIKKKLEPLSQGPYKSAGLGYALSTHWVLVYKYKI